jgi:hypothetical protein
LTARPGRAEGKREVELMDERDPNYASRNAEDEAEVEGHVLQAEDGGDLSRAPGGADEEPDVEAHGMASVVMSPPEVAG